MIAARFIVSGRVQGVCFRAATRERASRLRLRGHARNLPDGTVEVLAIGAEADIATLEHWLWQGPPLAQVGGVRRERIEPVPMLTGFDTA